MAVTPEQCVIGAMVYQPSSILYCIDHLKADDFADGSCAAAFAEIRDMYTQRGYFGKDDYVLMKNRDTVCTACRFFRALQDTENSSPLSAMPLSAAKRPLWGLKLQHPINQSMNSAASQQGSLTFSQRTPLMTAV